MNIKRNDPEQQFIEDIKSLLVRARSGLHSLSGQKRHFDRNYIT